LVRRAEGNQHRGRECYRRNTRERQRTDSTHQTHDLWLPLTPRHATIIFHLGGLELYPKTLIAIRNGAAPL